MTLITQQQYHRLTTILLSARMNSISLILLINKNAQGARIYDLVIKRKLPPTTAHFLVLKIEAVNTKPVSSRVSKKKDNNNSLIPKHEESCSNTKLVKI